jgi:DNA end-binding protein Ku
LYDFVAPEKDSVEAFTVIRKALQKTGRIEVGKVSFSGRENIVTVRAEGEGETGSLTAPEEAFPLWQTVLQSRLL